MIRSQLEIMNNVAMTLSKINDDDGRFQIGSILFESLVECTPIRSYNLPAIAAIQLPSQGVCTRT